MPRQRTTQGQGGLTRKQGRYQVKGSDQSREYKYWQASREVPAAALPEGSERKRITGSGSTPIEAWRRCNANYDAFLRGERRRGRTPVSPRVTLQILFEEWQATNEAGAVSPVMARKYQGYFVNHLLPHIGDRSIGSLTEADLTALFHRTLTEKQNPKTGKRLLSESARRNIYMAMSGCLQFAVRSRYLTENPLSNVRAPRKTVPNDDLDSALDAVDQILNIIQGNNNPDEARHLLAFLGLRRSERLGLCWPDVQGLDSDTPTLRVRQQLSRDPSTGRLVLKPHTKNGKDRSIALAEPFTGALRRLKARQERLKSSGELMQPQVEYADMLFLQSNGYPIDQNDDNDDWRALLATAGVPHFRAHLIRHITATMLAKQPNVPIATVMSILGHSTRAMTIYYAHVETARQIEPMTQLGEAFRRGAQH